MSSSCWLLWNAATRARVAVGRKLSLDIDLELVAGGVPGAHLEGELELQGRARPALSVEGDLDLGQVEGHLPSGAFDQVLADLVQRLLAAPLVVDLECVEPDLHLPVQGGDGLLGNPDDLEELLLARNAASTVVFDTQLDGGVAIRVVL